MYSKGRIWKNKHAVGVQRILRLQGWPWENPVIGGQDWKNHVTGWKTCKNHIIRRLKIM
jgi:hypothetical protein